MLFIVLFIPLLISVCIYVLVSNRTNPVSLQNHFPQEAKEKRRCPGHREMCNYVILVAHGRPISVLFLHGFLHFINKITLIKAHIMNWQELKNLFTLICCLFSVGTLFCWKNSLRTGGKHSSVCSVHECGVFCIIAFNNSLHHVPLRESAPVPVNPLISKFNQHNYPISLNIFEQYYTDIRSTYSWCASIEQGSARELYSVPRTLKRRESLARRKISRVEAEPLPNLSRWSFSKRCSRHC